jgi:hypothetical protein
MKQKNLTILSLLTSLMLLVFAGSALADVTVQFNDATFDVGRTGQTIEMEVTADNPISMFDVIAEIADGGAWGTITGASFDLLNGTGASDFSMMDGPTEDVFRLYATNLGSCDPVLDAGNSVVVNLTVDIGCDEGTFTINPTGINWEIDAYTTATTTFVGTDCAAEPVQGVMGTYTVQANAPFFTNCPTSDLVFECNEPANYDFDADDLDLGYCNEELTFDMVSGPGSIDGTTGAWTWNSVGMVGVHNVSVNVTDTYGYSATCDFIVVITNLPPVIDYCPPDYALPFDGISKVWVCFGDEAFGTVDAHDQDDPVCPGPLEYYLESFDGPGTLNVDTETGDWSWQTDDDPAYAGVWHVIIGVTDGVEEDDVFCEFDIRVTGIEVKIAKTGEDEFVFQGTYTEVPVYAFVDGQDVGGFEFLIEYDASALTFVEATLGDYLNDANWEYFTYRKGPFSNCGDNCPSGLVRIVGINDINNGMPHPNHPDSWFWSDSITVANLKFYVTDDRTYECQFVPIGFYWLDCGDNTISDSTGNQIFISRNVYWYSRPDDQYILLDPNDNPHIAGWQSIPAPFFEQCDAISNPDKPFPLGCVDFYFGGVDIACAGEIDLRGDLNLNNIANEIGDAVLYSNFFIYGPTVFTINAQGQIAASDVNNDGFPLTVGDLVYLIRIITGDAAPFNKLAPYANSVDVNLSSRGNDLSVTTDANVDIGAALFVFDDVQSADVVRAVNGMDLLYDVVDNQLRILVWDVNGGYIPSGETELFTVYGANEATLSDVSIVDYDGSDLTVNAHVKALPKAFALYQNSPNPFNPTTEIKLDLPEASNWSIDVYNVAGQLVKSFSGYSEAGQVTVTWDASGMASGIYLYRATVGSFTDVRKMVLMK